MKRSEVPQSVWDSAAEFMSECEAVSITVKQLKAKAERMGLDDAATEDVCKRLEMTSHWIDTARSTVDGEVNVSMGVTHA